MQGNLNARRRGLILMAYDRLDKDHSGVVTFEDIKAAYDTSKHPEVIEGTKTPDQVLREFMAQWETVEVDGVITTDEFLDYYKGEQRCAAVAVRSSVAFQCALCACASDVG